MAVQVQLKNGGNLFFVYFVRHQKVKSHKKCQNNWYCYARWSIQLFTFFFHSKAKAKKKLFPCTKAESTMIIENEVEIVQWLPLWLYFVCTFSMFRNARRQRKAKDNKENIGLGWKARALLTAPLEKIFCCCRLLASIFYAFSLLFCLMSDASALVNAFQWVFTRSWTLFSVFCAQKKQK